VVEEVIEEEPDTDPVSGGTLRYGLEADVDGINPTASALTASGLTMANAVFDTLAALDADGNAVPYLAESIEPVDGTLTQWRVKLREGIEFHDGTPLDAVAVKANFDAQLSNPLVGLAVRPFFAAENAATIVDELTIEYSLSDPTAVFATSFVGQLGMVASPTWLAAVADDPTLSQEPVGTGPFVFDSRSADSLTRVVRNDAWWGGEVYLDAIEFLPIPDPSARNDLFFNGDVEGLHTNDPSSVADLRDDGDVQNIVDETGEENLVMLNSSAPPFDDIRARKALALATPLTNERDLIGLGVSRGADQIFIPESPNYNPAVVQKGDDPDGAIALAAEYCADVPENCTDGKIDMLFQFVGGSVVESRRADILDEGWSVAFNVEYAEAAQDTAVQNVAFGRYQATMWRQFGGVEPLAFRQNLLCRTISEAISLNFPKYCSESRDALILEAQTLADPEDRVPLWKQITQDINDSYTYIFLRHTIWDTALSSDVRGMCDRTSPTGAELLCTENGRVWFDSVWITE
jgi:peptide/nickel transport system substrate-binding protein